jgi:hypothetical protein
MGCKLKLKPYHLLYFCTCGARNINKDSCKYGAPSFVDCRKIVGYKPDLDWECDGIGTYEQQEALRAKHPGEYVGGFQCPGCLTKEARDQFANKLVNLIDVVKAAAKEIEEVETSKD